MEKAYADELREEWLNIEADLELGKSIKKYKPVIKKRMKELFDLVYFEQSTSGSNEISMFFADLLVRYAHLSAIIRDELK